MVAISAGTVLLTRHDANQPVTGEEAGELGDPPADAPAPGVTEAVGTARTPGTPPPAAGTTRGDSTAVKITLAQGDHAVGVEIIPGHYVITADNPEETGNLIIESATAPLKANELLGAGEFGVGAAAYITDLAEGDLVRWKGVASITLRPAETRLLTELAPGNCVVGRDISPGAQLVTPTGQWSGNLRVYSTDGQCLMNQILDPTSADHTAVTAVFEDGQRIDISGVTSAKLTSAAGG